MTSRTSTRTGIKLQRGCQEANGNIKEAVGVSASTGHDLHVTMSPVFSTYLGYGEVCPFLTLNYSKLNVVV